MFIESHSFQSARLLPAPWVSGPRGAAAEVMARNLDWTMGAARGTAASASRHSLDVANSAMFFFLFLQSKHSRWITFD